MWKRFGILLKKRKTSAKSLPYVILTLILVGIVLSSIVLMVSYFYRITNVFENQNSLIDKAKSIRNFCIANDQIQSGLQKSYEDNFFEKTIIKKNNWGILDKVQFKVWNKNDTLSETLFIGEKRSENRSLYISNNNKQLKLGGKTVIQGNIYVPMKNFDEFYIPQKKNDIKIAGNVKQSSERLPKIKDFSIAENFEPVDLGNLSNGYSNHFFSTVKKVVLHDGVLENLKIEGNVIVESFQKLVIKGNTVLKDVIIVAPEVIIENNFTGTIQILSTKKITVKKNVTLKFPSVLYVKSKKEGAITIDEESIVLGAIIGVSQENKSEINIKENTKIVGDLYCTGNLTFKGEMFGSIVANELYFDTNESEYRNAALDLKIFDLPEFTPQLSLFEDLKTTPRILKCIN